jgi:3-hydroxyisobutyrate dehydrogenase
MESIALLGTGLLGAAFAEAAAKRGDSVVVWNRTINKATALSGFGVLAALSPADAVRGASRVHLVLKDDAVVNDVIAAMQPGLAPDAIILDHTTTLPALTAERAARLQAAGIKYLHCPVFMGPPAARNAQGSMMVAGPSALFESVRPALEKMTGRLDYLGERSDLAAANKLIGNAMLLGVYATLADVLTLAQAGGVDAEAAIKLLSVFDMNAMIATRGMNMGKGTFNLSFELDMARKDVRLMLETAGERPLAALPAVAARMDQLIAAGHGAADVSILGIDAVKR